MDNNDALMKMLQGAKQVMDVAEQKSPIVSKYTEKISQSTNESFQRSTTDEEEPVFLTEEEMMLKSNNIGYQQSDKNLGLSSPKIVNGVVTYKNLKTSKIPDAIKKAMVESPIEKISSPNHTFNLEDVSELINTPTTKPMNTKKRVNEVVNTKKLVGMTESQVRGIVKDEIVEFFTKYFAKTLAESVQEKVLKQVLQNNKKSR